MLRRRQALPRGKTMDVIEAIHSRRSIRAYRSEPVARALIEDVIWDAAQAPTPPVSGETPWVFCVIEGVTRIAGYGDRAKQYVRNHQLEGRHQTWPDNPDFKVFWDAPAVGGVFAQNRKIAAGFDSC